MKNKSCKRIKKKKNKDYKKKDINLNCYNKIENKVKKISFRKWKNQKI